MILNFDVIIRSIKHKSQRYETSGDWYYASRFWDPAGLKDCLFINVSNLSDKREMALIAIHELIEAVLCEHAGITEEQVDEFDKLHEEEWGDNPELEYKAEPGDDPKAPYHRQHQIATGIERILAAELGVDWLTYSRHIEELSK